LRYGETVIPAKNPRAQSAAAFIASLPFTQAESITGSLLLPDTRGSLTLLYAAIVPPILAQVFHINGNQSLGGIMLAEHKAAERKTP
tara:strand:- start:180135 stop:180395 length:261 start_codon:yes stop_codon:yes gene_type:complete